MLSHVADHVGIRSNPPLAKTNHQHCPFFHLSSLPVGFMVLSSLALGCNSLKRSAESRITRLALPVKQGDLVNGIAKLFVMCKIISDAQFRGPFTNRRAGFLCRTPGFFFGNGLRDHLESRSSDFRIQPSYIYPLH